MSSPTASSIPSPEVLAKRLENDIRRRGMEPGERYLSTRQVQRQYRVSLGVAAQAMQMLVDRRLLVRRDRSGTYVGDAAGRDTASSRVRLIYVLMHEDRAVYSMVPMDLLIESLRTGDPGVSVQVGFLPAGEELAYLRELLAPAQSAGQLAGVMPISCPREVYQYLGQLGVPMVVFGSLDPGQEWLTSIDVDCFQSGRLLAEYLLGQGHQRIAMLGASDGRPGDHAFLDGVMEAMTAAGRPANALMARVYPHDTRVLQAQAGAVLRGKDRPTGIICREERMLEITLGVVEELGLTVPGDVEMVFEGFATRRLSRSPYPHVRTRQPFEQIASQIAEMLRQQRHGGPIEPRHVVVPVELRVPERSADD